MADVDQPADELAFAEQELKKLEALPVLFEQQLRAAAFSGDAKRIMRLLQEGRVLEDRLFAARCRLAALRLRELERLLIQAEARHEQAISHREQMRRAGTDLTLAQAEREVAAAGARRLRIEQARDQHRHKLAVLVATRSGMLYGEPGR